MSFLLRKFKRGNVSVEVTIKWILGIGILIAVGFAIKSIVGKVAG
jgi:hypothetical protein